MPYKDLKKRKEYQKKYLEKWEIKNKDKRREYTKKHDKKRKVFPKRIKQLAEVRFRRHHRNKVKVLELYGKKCNYCGEDRYEFLSIDHINNDGARHKETAEYKRLNCGGMWGVLSHTEYRPDLYQVLCHNCNIAKEHYHIEPNKNGHKPFEYWREISKKRYN